MSIRVVRYPKNRICKEFYAVTDFLKMHGAIGYNKNWHWARWEWLLGHSSLEESTLPSIGLFMDGDEIVGLVTHDMREQAYIVLNPQYAYLKSEMVDYAFTELSRNGMSSLFVDEKDKELISIVKEKGYSMTTNSEYVLELDCSKQLSYKLDDRFGITDYHADKNTDKYVAVIHRGFGNDGEPITGLSDADFPEKPNDNPKLAVFIVAPNGDYAAHCGTWHASGAEICYVEPVVTIPEFRWYGIGKSVVYESINRCISMGAKKAIVISNQQFYYRIGFEKYSVCHLWEKKM
jgi:GNAT superfamily N-acetyltransferase